jgi:hypothetical protein
MAGYLDTYGVADERRLRLTKRIALGTLAAAIVGLVLFLIFHNFSEKRVVARFFDAVRAGNYQAGYRMWGCTPATPCRDYSYQKFLEDWGPKGLYANAKAARVTTVDSCGTGVVTTVEYPNAEPFGLYVDRGTKTLSFAPWPRCPGRHWHLWQFLERQFS